MKESELDLYLAIIHREKAEHNLKEARERVWVKCRQLEQERVEARK